MTEQLRPIPLRADYGAVARRNVGALARVAVIKAQAKLNSRRDERGLLRERWPDDPIAPLILRAASSPASVANTPALVASIIADVIATIGPTGAGARLLQAGMQLRFDNYADIIVPGLQASATNAGFVQESAPIGVTDLVTTAATLVPRKIASIATFTRETIESSNAERLVENALLRSIGLALDTALFDATAADAIRPAGLRHNIVALTAASDTNADDAMIADLSALGGAVAAIGEPIIFIVSPARAIVINLRARRSPFPYQVLPSPAVAPNDVIAVSPVGVASAVSDMPEIDSSTVATLHMEDTTPLPIVSGGGTVAAPTRSLMQTDSTGIRLRFDCDWVLRDQRAVAWTTATAW
jgi:hypothetical protein